MNTLDKLSRDVKLLIDSSKDLLSTNLVNASRNSNLDLTEKQLSTVIQILNFSLDEAYQRALPTYQNSIKKYIES